MNRPSGRFIYFTVRNPMTSDEYNKDSDLPAQEAEQEAEARELALSPYPRLDIPEGESPDLFAYLKSLPDVEGEEDDDEAVEEPAAVEKTEEQKKMEALAEKIRSRTKDLHLVTAHAVLLSEDSEFPGTLEMLSRDEAFKDIVSIAGQKDTYYYSEATMTSQYANIVVLIEEKDYLYTVAKMVRYHAETYPAPTAERYFTDPPYNFAKPHMERVRRTLQNDPRYEDIKEITAENGKIYLYSTKHMSEIYARSLVEYAEYTE